MRTELIRLADLTPSQRGAWRELADAAIEPNPYFDPDYVIPLAEGLAQTDAVTLAVVAAEDGWRACLPTSDDRWHRIPAPAVATWRGHVLYGLLGTPLVAAGSPEAAQRLEELLLGSGKPGFAAFEWLAADGPVARALGGSDREQIEFESFERAFVERRDEDTYLSETLSSKHRRELRRQRRKLGEALGAEVSLVDRSGDPAGVDLLLELEAAGSKGSKGTVLRAHPGHERFFRTMCEGFTARGAMQLLTLEAGDRALAVKCNLRAGAGLFMFKIAFDEEFAAYSPGIQLESEMLKVFHELPNADFMDSCADPNNAMINRLWPDRRRIASLVVPADGARGRLSKPAIRAFRELRERNRERKS